MNIGMPAAGVGFMFDPAFSQLQTLSTSGVSPMTLPIVSLGTGKVSWSDPTTNTDGTPIAAGEITGYVCGLRSLTVTGSVAGTYPIQSPSVAATAVSEALSAITALTKPDNYAVAVQAQSVNGPSAWSGEFQFQAVQPVPNSPSGVIVA